ncbi:MAG: hypothetical protein J1F35_05650 [Erysipelotrichales bacterium]|nr:hypothetical protein [Erysipelotrichales bacterium]
MKDLLTKDISRVWYNGQYYEKIYKGNKLIWPPNYLRHESIEYTFNENTGEFIVVQDAGFVEYLLENTTIYLSKCIENGNPVVIPLLSEPNYDTGGMLYTSDKLGLGSDTRQVHYKIDGSKSIYTTQSHIDFLTQIPTIYFRSKEVGAGLYDINFSTYPFEGCHEVFGPERLIGLFSGESWEGKWYSDVNTMYGFKPTFSQCREHVANKGKGWYGAYSEEIGVLMMLAMFKSGVNGRCLTYDYAPFGVANPFCNGGGGRNYMPNIEIDPVTNMATVRHLDGNIEYLEVPYIWSQSFSKLYWGEYLTIMPKESGSGIYKTNNECWMGNHKGTSLYLASGENKWAIAGDRDDSDVTGMQDQLRIRACYHGEYTITNDIAYFESLPIL